MPENTSQVASAQSDSKLQAACIDDFAGPEPAATWVAARLNDSQHELAAAWRAAFPGRELDIRELLTATAEYLSSPSARDIAANRRVMHRTAEVAARRRAQGASAPELLREYQALADLVERFLLDELRQSRVAFATDEVVRAMRAVAHAFRVVQLEAVDAFVRHYTDTIDRQSERLAAFGRVVGHEMRQPLGVLQLLPGVVPIRDGDHELTHLLDVFDRNVRRLTDVATRLERLSHEGLDALDTARQQVVELGVLVADVVAKLGEMALSRDVHIHIDAALPALRADPAAIRMIFTSLIVNSIEYADPSKPSRLVEVLARHDQAQPTVMVRDNGVGMPPQRVRHFFREFSRGHAHRCDGAHQGLGLGLSLVRNSMDACGGTVLLQSREGVGTTVTLSWPRRAIPAR